MDRWAHVETTRNSAKDVDGSKRAQDLCCSLCDRPVVREIHRDGQAFSREASRKCIQLLLFPPEQRDPRAGFSEAEGGAETTKPRPHHNDVVVLSHGRTVQSAECS